METTSNKTFKPFSKKQMNWHLLNFVREGIMKGYDQNYARDYSEIIGLEVKEDIYSIRTKHPFIKIVIFTSLPRMENGENPKSRGYGEDKVRVGMIWKIHGENHLKIIGQHPRIGTMFENLKKSLVKSMKEAESLRYTSPYSEKNGFINIKDLK